jgi:hypothetical protein
MPMRPKVWLDSALFDNGLLVGPDLGNTFDYLTRSVQAELAVHSLLRSVVRPGRATNGFNNDMINKQPAREQRLKAAAETRL